MRILGMSFPPPLYGICNAGHQFLDEEPTFEIVPPAKSPKTGLAVYIIGQVEPIFARPTTTLTPQPDEC